MPTAIKLYFKHYGYGAKYNYSCIHEKYKNFGVVKNANFRKLKNTIN